MSKIVFTGGGTLGHVIPNFSLIDELKQHEIFYIGSNGIEKEAVISRKIPYYEINTTKFYRGKITKNLLMPFKLVSSIRQAKKILKELKPDLIVSKGGYVSLPVCLAGRQLKIPIISHESDYSFGLANKIILRISKIMCVNYSHLVGNHKNVVYTGPIISSNYKLSNIKSNIKLKLDTNKPTILIVGGSSGSVKINEVVFSSLPKLLEKYNVVHLVGKGNARKFNSDNYNQFELCNNMPYLYSISDLVVGRAGAGVSFESAFMNKPMLLIPLENSHSRGDQLENAKYFQEKGGARILRENELVITTLLKSIETCFKNIDKMRTSLKNMDISQGKEKMVNLIKETLNENKKKPET